ncbi:MAG: glycosyltransferase family 2 protein [Candidatus Spechtbacterales bacterium]|nr:glycosyltransferase family 2 protein [Candidatus Spechtbacterales bacterium]
MKPRVDVNLIVFNGEKYIRHCLEAVKAQTYENINFRIFDNASTDNTLRIVKSIMPGVEVVEFDKNYVLGGGFNRSLYFCDSPYVIGLSVDVIMDPHFIEKAVDAMEENTDAGVLQAKILKWDFEEDKKTDIIDTTGMQIFKSRRIINRGHGKKDKGQYNKQEKIFLYEGAVPFFRRKALEDIKMPKFRPHNAPYASKADTHKYPYEYLDEDFVWYADEVDLGWRLQLLGWKAFYAPNVVAWHDRQTTKKLSGGYREFIKLRKTLPTFKRKLDHRNQRLAFIKNDFWGNIIKHAPFIFKRELFLFIYFIIWEKSSLFAYTEIIRLMPKMLRKRRMIMKKRKVSRKYIKKWFK